MQNAGSENDAPNSGTEKIFSFFFNADLNLRNSEIYFTVRPTGTVLLQVGGSHWSRFGIWAYLIWVQIVKIRTCDTQTDRPTPLVVCPYCGPPKKSRVTDCDLLYFADNQDCASCTIKHIIMSLPLG